MGMLCNVAGLLWSQVNACNNGDCGDIKYLKPFQIGALSNIYLLLLNFVCFGILCEITFL